MIKKISIIIKQRLKRRIATQLPYSVARTKKWHIERRTGTNIIRGTAIGFSYTPKDQSLVPGMLKSFDFVEFVVSYYDNKRNPVFNFNESKRHKAIIKKARLAGAKYFWGVGPKRRISKESVQVIRENMHFVDEGNILITNYRFFWGQRLKHIRTDGIWGRRHTSAFFPILKTNRYSTKRLHHPWRPKNLPKVVINANQYYVGRHTKEVLLKKFNFYKTQEYRTSFWKTATMDMFITDTIESAPIDEHVKGIGWREKRFKG